MRRLLLGVVLALVVSACSTSDDVAVPAAPDGAATGGTLRVAIPRPATIDPSLVSSFDAAGSLILRTMCDPLIQFDPVTGNPTPAIAESWQVTGGGGAVVVRLREGVFYHDGREVTSDDVLYSLSRAARPETASASSDLLSDIEGYGEIRGDLATDDASDELDLKGIDLIDKYSFELALTDRNADVFRILGHTVAVPLPDGEADEDPDAFSARPMCAGPYAPTAPWTGGDTITLRRHDGYHGTNTGFTSGGRGYADRIEFTLIDDGKARLEAMKKGEVDVAALGHAQRDGVSVVVKAPSPTLHAIGFPTSLPPFNQRSVRVALSQALDREALNAAAWKGARFPADGLLPSTVGDDLAFGCREGETPLNGDVESARALLASTGVSFTGDVVSLHFNDEFGNEALMKEVARQWEAAFGMVTSLAPASWDAHEAAGRKQEGFSGPFRLSWAAPYPSADAYFAPLFDSGSIGLSNSTKFSNREFDRVLERDARRATDPDERADFYEQLADQLCSEMPAAPVAFGARYTAIGKAWTSARQPAYERTTGDIALRELYRAD